MSRSVLGLGLHGCAAVLLASQVLAAEPAPLDRTILPIQEPARPLSKEIDARKVAMPPRFEVNAPAGAPNVVIVLVDDLGFGVPTTFGGPVPMATLDRLAQDGLRYNNFHTTALCSPTRAALKSGRNHHTVNMGFITEMATGMPGSTGQIPNATAPLAEMLRLNGYSTAAFGKWHETPAWEISTSGPFDRWPTHQGFDKFYGFLGGETNQWAPFLYDGVTQVELPNDPNYHFMTDMTEKARAWIKYQKVLTPDRPAFVYFAPGATHAPHHVPKDWIAKWKGKFDQGWDKLREETLARQIKMGIVPPDTRLAPKPPAIKDWDTLSADEQRLFARQAEVFAAFADYTDHEIGRLLEAFAEVGECLLDPGIGQVELLPREIACSPAVWCIGQAECRENRSLVQTWLRISFVPLRERSRPTSATTPSPDGISGEPLFSEPDRISEPDVVGIGAYRGLGAGPDVGDLHARVAVDGEPGGGAEEQGLAVVVLRHAVNRGLAAPGVGAAHGHPPDRRRRIDDVRL